MCGGQTDRNYSELFWFGYGGVGCKSKKIMENFASNTELSLNCCGVGGVAKVKNHRAGFWKVENGIRVYVTGSQTAAEQLKFYKTVRSGLLVSQSIGRYLMRR
jgi:hypothetical protein